jgi:cobalamin-dependent methionine synthase I
MIVIADNLHALNPEVSEALRKLDSKPLQDIALRCRRSGAKLIDINPGYLSRRNEDRMVFMVEAVQEVCSTRLVLDSPNPRLLEKGLAACREKPILNAVSLEAQKLDEILPLAVQYKTPLVALLMDERSFTPPRMEEKLALAIELRGHALAAGLPPEDLIFDPVLPNLSWPEAFSQVAETVKTIRMLSSGAIFQEPVRTMIGLSNLRSGLRNRYPLQLDLTCLGLLAGAGLHYALLNVFEPHVLEAAQSINQMSDF